MVILSVGTALYAPSCGTCGPRDCPQQTMYTGEQTADEFYHFAESTNQFIGPGIDETLVASIAFVN